MPQQQSFIKTLRYYLRPVKRIGLNTLQKTIPDLHFYLTQKIKGKPQTLNTWQVKDKVFSRANIAQVKLPEEFVISESFLAENKNIDTQQLIKTINQTLSQYHEKA